MQSHKQFLWRKGHEFALQKLGMSVLVAFDCKFEKPIRGCDLKVIEKNGAFQSCISSFKWGSSQIQH